MYGAPTTEDTLDWRFVNDELVAAGSYWLTPVGSIHPHSRPVWGVWSDNTLNLSVGSAVLRREMEANEHVSVHLGSDTDVVIVEGAVEGHTTDTALLAPYNAKYTWDYDYAEYGPFTVVKPNLVIAWRSAGWAGNGGFRHTGRWTFDG